MVWWMTAVRSLNFFPGNGNPLLVSPLVGLAEFSKDSTEASGGAFGSGINCKAC